MGSGTVKSQEQYIQFREAAAAYAEIRELIHDEEWILEDETSKDTFTIKD